MTAQSPVPVGTDVRESRMARAINALIARLTDVGTTDERPARPVGGQMRWNETTKKPEWWDAASGVWRDATGSAV